MSATSIDAPITAIPSLFAGEDIAALMSTRPGETEPEIWYERFPYREPDPDALITGTTEAYVRGELVYI